MMEKKLKPCPSYLGQGFSVLFAHVLVIQWREGRKHHPTTHTGDCAKTINGNLYNYILVVFNLHAFQGY